MVRCQTPTRLAEVEHPLIRQLITESENKEKEELIAQASSDGKLKQMVDLACSQVAC